MGLQAPGSSPFSFCLAIESTRHEVLYQIVKEHLKTEWIE